MAEIKVTGDAAHIEMPWERVEYVDARAEGDELVITLKVAPKRQKLLASSRDGTERG